MSHGRIFSSHENRQLPREASEAFSKDLLPSLLLLKDWRNTPVWAKAERLFQEKVAAIPKSEVWNTGEI
jgi:saccharopine dehydrogenase (NAD+, L-lysine-forming)